MWQFQKNNAPMYATCIIQKDDSNYVVCGGFDNSIYYLNADGHEIKQIKSSTYAADEYYKTVEKTIQEGMEFLPLSVEGEVGWIVAQTSSTHVRLTLVDRGYLNPSNKKAIVHFHSVKPKNMVDLLDGKSFDLSDLSQVEVDIPCGVFRFIDIELAQPLPQ